MQALISEAHRLGRKVATHAHSANSIKDAVRAGVDSIEHGIFIDEESIQLMKQHGTYLSATTFPLFWYEKNEDSLHLPSWVLEKVAIIIPAAKVNVARAYQEGVKVALGTDAGVYPHGLNAGEFWSMVRDGTDSGAIAASRHGECRGPDGLERQNRRDRAPENLRTSWR